MVEARDREKLETRARELLEKITDPKKLPDPLTETDFDQTVIFWSR